MKQMKEGRKEDIVTLHQVVSQGLSEDFRQGPERSHENGGYLGDESIPGRCKDAEMRVCLPYLRSSKRQMKKRAR